MAGYDPVFPPECPKRLKVDGHWVFCRLLRGHKGKCD